MHLTQNEIRELFAAGYSTYQQYRFTDDLAMLLEDGAVLLSATEKLRAAMTPISAELHASDPRQTLDTIQKGG